MKSDRAKVLHPVAGVPMVERVLRSLDRLKPAATCVIVGHQGDQVTAHVKRLLPKTTFARQRVLDGSGGAARQALSWLRRQKGDVVVACGDAPLIRTDTFRRLLSAHRREKNVATVLTTLVLDPSGYGRIVRGYD